jgi:hypothetical protein
MIGNNNLPGGVGRTPDAGLVTTNNISVVAPDVVSNVNGTISSFPVSDLISADTPNEVILGSDGLILVKPIVVFDDQILTASDTSTVDMTLVPSTPTGADNQVNYTIQADVKPCGVLKALPNNNNKILLTDLIPTTDGAGNCELKLAPTICEQIDLLPIDTYKDTDQVVIHRTGVPATFVGFEFDYGAQFSTTDASDTYMHILRDDVNSTIYFIPPALTNPTTPILFTNAGPIQSIIDQIMVANSFPVGSMVWNVISSTQVVVWWDSTLFDAPTLFPNMFWGGTSTPDGYTAKTFPQIPTTVVAGQDGCFLVTLPTGRFRDYTSLVANTPYTVNHNFGFKEVMVEVRDNLNGALTSCRVINETSTSCQIIVPVDQPNVRITVR